MRHALWLLTLTLLMGVYLFAQQPSEIQLFGGYSYRIREIYQNLHGWNAALEARVTDRLGVVADFAGAYGHEGSDPLRIHSFVFGPRLSLGSQKHFRPFAHALFGGIRTSRTTTLFINPPCPETQQCFPEAAGSITLHDKQLVIALGGGFDFRLRDRLGFRLVQADYFPNRRDQTFNRWEDNWRLSCGFVFDLNRR